MNKKQVRSCFRRGVLQRDKYRCCCCNKLGYDRQEEAQKGKVPLDAHHIVERTKDNYVLNNGITVCDECHLKAEKFHITNGKEWVVGFHPNELFEKINSNWRV